MRLGMLPQVLLVLFAFASLAQGESDDQDSDDYYRRGCRVTTSATEFPTAFFNDSKWIWTGENPEPGGYNSVGARAFRKKFRTPRRKCATCASILVTSDDVRTIYVNGVEIGSGEGWGMGQSLFSALKPSSNLFAFSVYNKGGPASLMATITIHYSDGSHETIVTDESWKTFKGDPPQEFQLPSSRERGWEAAAPQGTYQNPAHPYWGQPSLPPILPFSQSKWIWTSDSQNGAAPVGTSEFRKVVKQSGKRAVCATMVIAADDKYTVYLNRKRIGAGESYTAAKAFHIPKLRPSSNTFSVRAYNKGGPAGVIATVLISYHDGSNDTIVTDGTWKASKGGKAHWEDATVVWDFGGQPWGETTIPSA